MAKVAIETVKTVTSVITETSVALLDATEALDLIAKLNETKAAAKAIKEQEETLRSTIIALLGDAKEGSIGGVTRVRLLPRERKGIDTKMLAEAFPEAAEACATVTHYEVLDTK